MVRRIVVDIGSRLDGHDLGPRDHHFFHDRIGEPENAVDQVFFGRFEYAALAPLPDKIFDLIFGDKDRFLARPQS